MIYIYINFLSPIDLFLCQTQIASLVSRSRFVTKMIPIQATCFATMEEIKPAAKSLLEHFLMPHGIKIANDRSETFQSDDGKPDDVTNHKNNLPTFKIEFRKRFCSHLKRDDVISVIADSIGDLTSEYWLMKESKRTNLEEKRQQDSCIETDSKFPPLFGVDLGNPDYTIIIEVCRTLCTMSVVKNAQSYHHFNLMKIQEQINSQDET